MSRKNVILISLIFIFLFCSSAFAIWTVTPTSINFGDIPVGTSKTLTLVLTNTGNTAVNIQKIYSSIPEVTTDPSSGNLAGGGTMVIAVTFKPTARGTYSGELVIVSNDPTTPSITVPFTATSSYATGIDVSPTSIDFGFVSVGQSKTDYVRVSNNGTSDLNVTVSVTAGTPFTVSKSSFTIRPGEIETLTVTFAPTEKGSYSAALTIISDDKNTPKVVVSLTGNTGTEFGLYYFPFILNFGNVAVNTSYERTLKIYNTTANIVSVSISVQNISGNAFSLPSSVPTSFSLIPGEMRLITVKFLPTEKVNYSGFLYLVTNSGIARISILGSGADATGGLEPQNPPPSSGDGGGGGGGCSLSGNPKDISLLGNNALMIMPLVAIALRKLYRKFIK